MNNSYKLFWIVITVSLSLTWYSCSDPLDKSIFEPLSAEELKSIIEEDSIFKLNYKYITKTVDSTMTDEMDRVDYLDLTYRRVQEYIHFARDTGYFNPLYKELKKKWRNRFEVYLPQVDSISNYWKAYKEKNSPEQYVKVELVELDKEYYSYSGGVRKVKLGFRLTPLKGKVDQLTFRYLIEAKINEDNKASYLTSLSSAFDWNYCLLSRPLYNSTVFNWEADYDDERTLKNRTISSLKRDYNIHIEVREARINGVNLKVSELDIPFCVRMYWKYEEGETMKDSYAVDIINEYLNSNIKNEFDYIQEKFDSVLKEKDLLCYKFYNI